MEPTNHELAISSKISKIPRNCPPGQEHHGSSIGHLAAVARRGAATGLEGLGVEQWDLMSDGNGYATDLVGGWATPLKNMKVNWDDDIPNIWENKKWQPNHQPVMVDHSFARQNRDFMLI